VTRNEQLREVIGLACLTEDRTDAEQRALIAWAWDCDVKHNANVVTNKERSKPGFALQDLVSIVQESRLLQDGQHEVKNPNRWKERWLIWTEGR
jgi:hypothetical protein